MRTVSTVTIAPSYTLLGKLQRGLGAGYLEALRIERDAAHELLLACLAEDPRHDPATESRGRYYGELCRETQIELAELAALVEAADTHPATRRLVLETVGARAWRGIAGPVAMLRAYVAGGGEEAALAFSFLWHPRASAGLEPALLARYGTAEALEEALAHARLAPPEDPDDALPPPAGEPLALVEALALALERDECVCELSRALARVTDDPLALLERAFRQTSRSSCRVTIARELARASETFPARGAEYLWDAEPGVVAAAAATVSLEAPGARARLETLARDGLQPARSRLVPPSV
jgi:hypothetical protein